MPLLRCLRRLGAALSLSLLASHAQADAATDKDQAIDALLDTAVAYAERADEITRALQTPDAYVFLLQNGWGDEQLAVVKREQVEAFVGYLQVENLLHPGTLDQARIAKVASALKIPSPLVDLMLADRQAVLAAGGAAVAQAALRKRADELRPGLEQYERELAAEAEAALAEADRLTKGAVWPPPQVAGNVFAPVQVGGMTVDYCMSFATNCGQPVMDEFCRQKGFTRATSFEWAYTRPTRTLGSGETCDQEGCGGFTRVTCE